MTGQVVVGIDGSEGSRHALAWALQDAALRRSVLEAVIVWQHPSDFERRRQPAEDDELAAGARGLLVGVLNDAVSEGASVDVESVVLEGDPAVTLCMRADEADVLVVGSRGHGNLAGLLLGSVSSKCAQHSRVPVVIVPPVRERGPVPDLEVTRRIVVGLDGSVGSRRALRWALDEAVLRSARVEAVAVWRGVEAGSEMGEEYRTFPSLGRRDRAVARATTERLEEIVSEFARESAPVEIERRVIEGNPAEVLCDLAAGAELLVVGSRGHGTVAGLLLGSVSTACAHSSPRPVMIVPTDRVASSEIPQAGT